MTRTPTPRTVAPTNKITAALWIPFILCCYIHAIQLVGVNGTNQSGFRENHAIVIVVGSINADTFLPVSRLPREGENLTLRPDCSPTVDVPGGKGCTQAVAAAKLMMHTCFDQEHRPLSISFTPHPLRQHDRVGKHSQVAFVGQFGNDRAASTLREALAINHVDLSYSGHHKDFPSGRGYVFITESGSVSAVVSGGSNTGGWASWKQAWESPETNNMPLDLNGLLGKAKGVMLQREVPEYVNLLVASEARKRGGILVFQDVGGEDRPITREMMELCDYLIPNESELRRLLESLGERMQDAGDIMDRDDTTIVKLAKCLQMHGARNVLVTRGSRGCTLVTEDGAVLHQSACDLAESDVLDETGAGDCFRAAFCVAVLEQRPMSDCLQFASAAGACAVTKAGAVPSTPTREEVDVLYHAKNNTETVLHIPRGGKRSEFPFLFGSRLNSMKDRPELWAGSLNDARDYVERQASIQGLTCVDFNYPQHFQTWTVEEAKSALDDVGLKAGAVCLRYPSKFARGAMNHPHAQLRREALELTREAAEAARLLGCDEVVVWSAFDGYDYPFQVDYDEMWSQIVNAFRELCDEFSDIKFSLEYKPTDENTRFFTVPSTGAAMLLVRQIDRPNMGLTLDIGHLLMSGENPGQSIAMVGKKLFGIQLNDGYTRLAAEDGMMFGSIHPTMALEVMYQLHRIGFSGHFYFDTFPQRSDPIKEAEYNIDRTKRLWKAAKGMNPERLTHAMQEHDALEALNLVNDALRKSF